MLLNKYLDSIIVDEENVARIVAIYHQSQNLRLFFEEKYDKFVVAERVLCCEPAGRWSDSVEDYPSGSRGRTRNALGRLYRCVGSNPMSSANYEI